MWLESAKFNLSFLKWKLTCYKLLTAWVYRADSANSSYFTKWISLHTCISIVRINFLWHQCNFLKRLSPELFMSQICLVQWPVIELFGSNLCQKSCLKKTHQILFSSHVKTQNMKKIQNRLMGYVFRRVPPLRIHLTSNMIELSIILGPKKECNPFILKTVIISESYLIWTWYWISDFSSRKNHAQNSNSIN